MWHRSHGFRKSFLCSGVERIFLCSPAGNASLQSTRDLPAAHEKYCEYRRYKGYQLQQNQTHNLTYRGGATLRHREARLHALSVPCGQDAEPQALRRPLPLLRLRGARGRDRPHSRAARLFKVRGGVETRSGLWLRRLCAAAGVGSVQTRACLPPRRSRAEVAGRRNR